MVQYGYGYSYSTVRYGTLIFIIYQYIFLITLKCETEFQYRVIKNTFILRVRTFYSI